MWLGGCASNIYEVRVTAVAPVQGPKPASFRLLGQANSPSEQGLLNEAVDLARQVLKNKGFNEAAGDITTPDLFVAVSCGLGVGSTRHGTTEIPYYITIPGKIRRDPTAGSGASAMVQDPSTEAILGYDHQKIEIKALKKYLRLVAFEKNPLQFEQTQIPVWAVQAVYESEDARLRKVLPVLAAAAMVFVGSDSKGAVPIRMRDSDQDVSALRSGR